MTISPKAYRFYFRLLYENEQTATINNYLTAQFLYDCMYHGHSWEVIVNNYKYLVKSGLQQEKVSKVIVLSEMNKILVSTKDDFEHFVLYFSALGSLRGFEEVVKNLSFEGEVTVPVREGLIACYCCQHQGVNPPWELYLDYFPKNEGINVEDFYLYLAFRFCDKDFKDIERIAKSIHRKYPDYAAAFKQELIKWKDQDVYTEILSNCPTAVKIIAPKGIKKQRKNLAELCEEVKTFTYINEQDRLVLESFIEEIKYQFTKENSKAVKKVFTAISGVNWFYNWVIFYAKVNILSLQKTTDFSSIEDAFQYLVYDTEPFKGEPRTTDLYQIKDLIIYSLEIGFNLLKNKSEWEIIIGILNKCTAETATEFQKSKWGAISKDAYLSLLERSINNENTEVIIDTFEQIIEQEKYDSLYTYLSEFYFRLTKLYCKSGQNEKGEEAFKKGIKYALSYGFRKDTTLEELMLSVESINQIDTKLGASSILKLKDLADAVVDHTDGKGTKWFPITWFKKFYQINSRQALMYLAKKSMQCKFDWREEKNLIHFLEQTNGKINPITELFIARTFTGEDSELFLNYCLNLVELVKPKSFSLAKNFLGIVSTRMYTGHDTKYSLAFLHRLRHLREEFRLHKKGEILEKQSSNSSSKERLGIQSQLEERFNPRKELAEMSLQEIISYIENYGIRQSDLQSYYYYFQAETNVTTSKKEVLGALLGRKQWLRKDKTYLLDVIFDDSADMSVYYWVCRFVYDKGGWLESFENIDAFKTAYYKNSSLALSFLFSEMESMLFPISYQRTISANLINMCTVIQHDEEEIKAAWKNLYNIIGYRLPDQRKSDWEFLSLGELANMEEEELLIGILLTRFRANDTERHHWTIGGLSYIFQNNKDKIVKPLKWMFSNWDHYLEATNSMVLNLLLDFFCGESDYLQQFEKELTAVYPTNHFFLDFQLGILLNKPLSKRKLIEPKLIYPVDNNVVEYFLRNNFRLRKLHYLEFNIENIIGEYLQNFKKAHKKDLQDLFATNSKKPGRNNLYPANYIWNLVNKNFYNDLQDYLPLSLRVVYETLKIDNEVIVAQTQSATERPKSLLKPSEVEKDWMVYESIPSNNGWVRLASVETEHLEKGYDKYEEIHSFQGLSFGENPQKTLPFSSYKLIPEHIWRLPDVNGPDESKEVFPVMSYLQLREVFEIFKLLWLSPSILNTLELKAVSIEDGLKAANSQGEIVLEYRSWQSNYLSNFNFAHTVPGLDGADLIIREDYFQKLCDLKKNRSPKFCAVKIFKMGE